MEYIKFIPSEHLNKIIQNKDFTIYRISSLMNSIVEKCIKVVICCSMNLNIINIE